MHLLEEVLPQVAAPRRVAVHPLAAAREAAAVVVDWLNVVPRVPAAAADNAIGRSVAVAIDVPKKC